MEEVKFDNIMDGIETVTEVVAEPNFNGKGGVIGLAVGIGVAAVAGVGALVYKSRGKIEEMNVRRLEKKGYVITKPEPVDEVSKKASEKK